MKIIFSRKGFDSSYGGYPSIILPDNKMISFPIPEANPKIKVLEAENIEYIIEKQHSWSLKDIFEKLKIDNKIKIPAFKGIKNPTSGMEWECKDKLCQEKHKTVFHYDPQIQEVIQKNIYDPEKKITRDIQNDYAAFGQSGAAASHLLKQKINKGDLFLFFGTFRNIKEKNGDLEYYGPKFHAIWGYMFVDDVFKIEKNKLIDPTRDKKEIDDKIYPNINLHPHYLNQNTEYEDKNNNIIFCSKRFGTFDFTEEHRLSKNNETKSLWELQDFFKGKKISYCGEVKDPSNFKSASIGQEFVVDHDFNKDPKEYDSLKNWLTEKLKIKKSYL